jgi:hypothetical protein
MEILLGIDDTDVLGHRPGTGRLARDLGAYLAQIGLARLEGVVRHQLLVDPRIPYTSHNSPACVILDVSNGASRVAQRVFEMAADYLIERCALGSDPGLCLVERQATPEDAVTFGRRAASEVLRKQEALELAQRHGLRLQELGGTGGGVIGALAAVGLTADGNAGRFLELGGNLRDFPETVGAADLRRRGITLICVSRNGEAVPADAVIHTGEWLRPRLIGRRPVLFLENTDGNWRCFDRKQKHEHPVE